MKLSRVLFSLALLFQLQSASRARAIDTSDPFCTIPPSNAISTTMSDDLKYLAMWQSESAVFDDLWGGLRSDADDWDDGWGWGDRTNLNRMLPRLINGAQLIWLLQQYSKNPGFGLGRPVTDAPDNLPLDGRWWDFMAEFAEDEWEPGCSDEDANAKHFTLPFDEFNTLQLNGAYGIRTISRASSMIHEIVHQDVGHLFIESSCNPSTPSCDDQFGKYNANTLHVNFLHDAMVAFQTQDVGGELLRTVSVDLTNDVCTWLPLFSANEIASANNRANEVAIRFETDAYSGWRSALTNEVLARQAEGTWACESCDPNDMIWVFDNDLCDQTACNETMNAGNAVINNVNRTACVDYNTAVSMSTGPESVGIAKHFQTQQTKPCLPASEADARNYCNVEKLIAGNAKKIDECGWLDPVSFPSISKVDCVQEFCHDKYDMPGEVPSDFYDCLDYFCGEDSACGSGEDVGECSDWFKTVKGDPDFYVAGCEWNKCKARKIECLKEAHAAGTWVYGDPVPVQCSAVEEQCNLISRLAAEAFINLNPFLERHPMREVFEGVGNLNPGKNVFQFAEQIRQASADGDIATVEAMAIKLTSTPEMIAALFNAAPAEFVGLYGAEGFETILGPKLRAVTGQALEPDKLTPAGRAALLALQEQLELAGGSFKGAIGTLTYGH